MDGEHHANTFLSAKDDKQTAAYNHFQMVAGRFVDKLISYQNPFLVVECPGMNELKNIPGFPGYSADPDGNIWTFKACRNLPIPYKLKLWKLNKGGYLGVCLQDAFGKKTTHQVHRIIALTFIGSPPFWRALVLHSDGNRQNNSAKNLRYGNWIENSEDRKKHGLGRRGSARADAKLTEEAVRDIKKRELTTRQYGAKYGVNNVTISQIWRGISWSHV